MLHLPERMKRLTTVEIVASYSAKFFLGLGLGLLFGHLKTGWLFVLLAIAVGLPVEIKFWRKP